MKEVASHKIIFSGFAASRKFLVSAMNQAWQPKSMDEKKEQCQVARKPDVLRFIEVTGYPFPVCMWWISSAPLEPLPPNDSWTEVCDRRQGF